MQYIKSKYFLSLVVILVLSFLLRHAQLDSPFWVDEFSSATQARIFQTYGLHSFSQDEHYFEHHNVTTHALIATAFSVLGESESSARLPSLFFGILVPALVFIIIKRAYGMAEAWSAAILSIFSYTLITWSHQARGYALQQILLLTCIILYLKIYNKKFSLISTSIFVICCILGLLTHTTFVLALAAFSFHFLFTQRKKVWSVLQHPIALSVIFLFFLLSLFTGLLEALVNTVQALVSQGLVQNVWYYHAYLWRTHGLLTFLAAVGILLGLIRKRNREVSLLLTLVIGLYLFFACFIFAPYVSRYIVILFPLLYGAAAITIVTLATQIQKKYTLILTLVLTFGIVVNGHTFTLKPKNFYSVNHFMREIALIDYDALYSIIQEKGELEQGKTAVIDTWPDRVKWYLGDNTPYMYAFRWEDSLELTNGLPRITPTDVDSEGRKYIPKTGTPPIGLVQTLEDFEAVMNKYPKGFLLVDDATMSQEIIQYAENKLTTELYTDHYALDDNPYSIWPTTLYSWGFEGS